MTWIFANVWKIEWSTEVNFGPEPFSSKIDFADPKSDRKYRVEALLLALPFFDAFVVDFKWHKLFSSPPATTVSVLIGTVLFQFANFITDKQMEYNQLQSINFKFSWSS